MLPEDLSVLQQFEKNDDESLLDRYADKESLSGGMSSGYASVLDNAQRVVYKQESSVLDNVHKALSNSAELNKVHQNASFNIKGQNLGQMGVIERMSGMVANREDLDFDNISLSETYRDKSLDTKVMGGLYNFTLSDIYKDKNRWLQTQGAFTFGGFIKGNNDAEIETDSSDEYSGPIKDNENVFENKTANKILTSGGLQRKRTGSSNLSGSGYGVNEYDENSIEGATIYNLDQGESKKEDDKPKKSMREILEAQNQKAEKAESLSLENNSKSKILNLPVYTDGSIYTSKAANVIENSHMGQNYNQAKKYKQIHKLNLKDDKKKKVKRKLDRHELLYGMDIDTLKETRDGNKQLFGGKQKQKVKSNQKIDTLNVEQKIENIEVKKEVTKIDLKKELSKQIIKKEVPNKEKVELKKEESLSLDLSSNKNKKIEEVNLEEGVPKLKKIEEVKQDTKIETKKDFDFSSLDSNKEKEIPKIKLEDDLPKIKKEVSEKKEVKLQESNLDLNISQLEWEKPVLKDIPKVNLDTQEVKIKQEDIEIKEEIKPEENKADRVTKLFS